MVWLNIIFQVLKLIFWCEATMTRGANAKGSGKLAGSVRASKVRSDADEVMEDALNRGK
jgi:hypothetical protein